MTVASAGVVATDGEGGIRGTAEGRAVRAASPRRVELSYLAALVAGGTVAFAALLGALGLLALLGRLPPPAIANSLCVDEKLAFHRANPPRDPTVLVIGSSVAWRGFDGATFAKTVPGARALNGAFCGLSAAQSAFVADWWLDRLPSARDVVMIAAPQDLADCTSRPAAAFDRPTADAFVFDDRPAWSYYLRRFDLRSLVRNAAHVAGLRSGADPLNALVFTPSGDGPMDTGASQASLMYGPVGRADPACLGAVRRLALRLAGEGRRFLVAATPLHPEWRRRFDPDGRLEAAMDASLRGALAGTGAIYWEGDGAVSESSAFTDAIHLRWSAVADFTRDLGAILLRPSSPKPASAGMMPERDPG